MAFLLLIVGFTHHEAGDTNQCKHTKQQQFWCVVQQAVKDIRIYWTPGDHRTPVLGRYCDYRSLGSPRSSCHWLTLLRLSQ